jgi:hypothetical protein
MQTRPARQDRPAVDLRRLVSGFLRMAPSMRGGHRERPSQRPFALWVDALIDLSRLVQDESLLGIKTGSRRLGCLRGR